MKTNTMKTIAALVGSALILTNSVLAGPDAQSRNQATHTSSSAAKVDAAKIVRPLSSDFKSTISTQPKERIVSTPHGNITVLL